MANRDELQTYLVLVPLEPTEAMLDAAEDWLEIHNNELGTGRLIAEKIYRAMIEASDYVRRAKR